MPAYGHAMPCQPMVMQCQAQHLICLWSCNAMPAYGHAMPCQPMVMQCQAQHLICLWSCNAMPACRLERWRHKHLAERCWLAKQALVHGGTEARVQGAAQFEARVARCFLRSRHGPRSPLFCAHQHTSGTRTPLKLWPEAWPPGCG